MTRIEVCAAIYEPSGPLSVLSNYAITPIRIGQTQARSVEHYFQASKFLDSSFRKEILQTPTAAAAKALAWSEFADRARQDWDRIRVKVMRRALHEKFSQ